MAGSLPRNNIRVDIDEGLVGRICHTEKFHAIDDFVVIRRGTTIPIQLKARGLLTAESAALLHGREEIAVRIRKQDSRVYGTLIELHVPANAPVTLYKLKIKGAFVGGSAFEVELKKPVVVLFNAWSREDGVYLDDEAWREEYVLNSNGRVYRSLEGTAWNLGLYQPDTLKAVLYLLETVSKLSFEKKSDPVEVVREMSAMVNAQDDDGVLEGNWDGNYSDGKPPSFWMGSGPILHQYYRTGGVPVRYGQCWVFSGVLLTVLRVLGIPSRSVTNFNSAHDMNQNRTIDEYYNEEGERIRYLNTGKEYVWNFHVWNETWMNRPDLPPGFDGWQALDATPQEDSVHGGGCRTGPSPVAAIKEGNSLPFDTNFLIGEVNADIKKYKVDKDGIPHLFAVDTKSVGKTISTKKVGSLERDDITHLYKYPEGSDWERRALYNGYKELMKETRDVEFSIPEVEYEFGQDVTLTVKATNKTGTHGIRGKIECNAVSYTGRLLEEVDTSMVEMEIDEGKTEELTKFVSGGIFTKFPGTKVYLKFTVTLSVMGTSQMFSETVSVAPNPPKLHVKGPEKMVVGSSGKLLMGFKNPLPVAMEDVTLNIDFDVLSTEVDVVHKIGTIGPNAEVGYSLDISGSKLGKHMIVVGLVSDKVEHVSGEIEIEVVKSLSNPPPLIPFDALDIESYDLNRKTNQTDHYTDAFEYPGLVVRRGKSFTITVTTTKPFPNGAKVVTRAIFQLVSKHISKRTAFDVLAVSSTSDRNVELKLTIPPDVSVGEYELLLTVDDEGKISVFRKNIKIVILFNPWCPDDSCYYPHTSDLDEYVLNPSGRIWVGSSQSHYGRPWQFSQFSKDSLEVVLWALDLMKKSRDQADPVQVVRHVSAIANSNDDDGILVGNWTGDFSGGTMPTEWTGSGPILAQFNASKEPVCYGQCWVFSGVQTTLLRCMGLAARSVTNFDSGHDTDFNRALDLYFDEGGYPLKSADSKWNFHVWNEAWMARPDLPAGFGGWQALDATPQEDSPHGGGHRLGPASVRAVKFGQRMNYDVEFVISEVNADMRLYTVHSDGTKTLSGVNTTYIGKNISTKAVGSNNRHDITMEYKFKEGSTSERAALLAETESEKNIGVKLEVGDNVEIGQDFTVKATVTNKVAYSRTLKVRMYGRAVQYTGAPGQMVRETSDSEKFDFFARESKTFEMPVADSDYLRILQGGNFINFVCIVLDKENKQSVIATENFRLKTPDIAIGLPEGDLKLYHPVELAVSFTNPLDKVLTGGKFTLSGGGYVNDASVTVPSVNPRQVAKAVLKTIAIKKGSFELLVRFSSSQLTDIMGDKIVEIK